MTYICMANHDTEVIECAESYEDDSTDLPRNRQRLQIESQMRTAQGKGDWQYHEGSSAYAFPTEAEKTAAETAEKKAAIVAQLAELDSVSLRALRAVAAGTSTTDDTTKLADYEAQAVTLRAKQAAL